jgi:Ran GTPase-activating protein (RanGAP) involved in mRNA processing and transport
MSICKSHTILYFCTDCRSYLDRTREEAPKGQFLKLFKVWSVKQPSSLTNLYLFKKIGRRQSREHLYLSITTMATPFIVLNVPGDRDVRISQVEAREIVARWLEQGKGSIVRAVDLSGRSWSAEASDLVSTFLSDFFVSSGIIVRSVSLADCIAGLTAEEGRYVLARLARPFASSKLIEINLRDNSLGWIGMACIKPLFYGANRLESLDVSNGGLGSASMELLKSIILADGGRIASSLTKIVLDRNAIGPDGSKHVGAFLSQCRKLQTFSFAGCNPETSGTMRICQALFDISGRDPLRRPNFKLLHLDLSDCSIGRFDSDPIVPLCYAITNCKQLRYLNLSGGGLLTDGLQNVLTALAFSKTWLTDLNLGTSKRRVALLFLFVPCPCKTRWKGSNHWFCFCILTESNSLGPEGARILSQYIQMRGACLRSLNLNSNELEDEGVCLLLQPFASASTDKSLEVLFLDQNEIGPTGAKALRLARLDNLKLLSLAENDDMPQRGLIETYGNRVSFGNTEDGVSHHVASEPKTISQFEPIPQSETQMSMHDLVSALKQTNYQVDDVLLLQDKQEEVLPDETDVIESSRKGETDEISQKAENQSIFSKVNNTCVAQDKHEGAVLSAAVSVDKAQMSQGNNKGDGISELFRKKQKSAKYIDNMKAQKRSDPGHSSVRAQQNQHSSSMGEIAEFSKKVEERYEDWKEDTASNEKPEVLPLTSPVDLGKPFRLAMQMTNKSDALEDNSDTEWMASIQFMTSLQIGTPPRGPKPEPKIQQAATEPLKITGTAGVTLFHSPRSKQKVKVDPLKQRPSIVDQLSISEACENHAQVGNTQINMHPIGQGLLCDDI